MKKQNQSSKKYTAGRLLTKNKMIGLGVVIGIGILGVSLTGINHAATTVVTASDNFTRANGGLGANWTPYSEGGLKISSNAVVGANSATTSGNTYTASTFTANQYSQITVTATPLSGGQWIGPTVRSSNNGQNLYLGLYDYNNGAPYLQIFKRTSGNWVGLSGQVNCNVLASGVKLKLEVVGSTIAFLKNGVEQATAYDNSISSGQPGIAAFGAPTADTWSASTIGYQFNKLSTDANGVKTYDMVSATNGYGAQKLRVLEPTAPKAGVVHNFIYTLPVQPGADNTGYADGLDYLQSLNAQNQYNLTIIEPSFHNDPWYANNPNDANVKYENFMANELQPWAVANLATSGTEQNWLIGFSKSGIGGIDLLLKHPNLFQLGAFWDFPGDMSAYDQFGADSAAGYGTDANFQNNYRLTQTFVNAHSAQFTAKNRIWIGGYNLYQPGITYINNTLNTAGVKHTNSAPVFRQHRWDSGWVSGALTSLNNDSLNL